MILKKEVICMEDYDKGYEAALRYIANRMKTEEEVRKKLKAGFSEQLIGQIIAKLKENSYIDDSNYVTCYIRDRIKFNPMGRLRIKKELQQRGIAKNLIEENSEYNTIDEKSLIEDILDTKLSHLDLQDKGDTRKVLGYLSRRGFEYSCINSVLGKRKIHST